MSGAARAAWPADTVVGTRRETDVPVLTVATLHCPPRAERPGTTGVGQLAHLSLVIPSDAVPQGIAAAALGEVSGQSGTADAGVC
ncbi:MAG TPA: hypothetical protein VGL80_10360 [Pseudonocardiaceae bacterium]|jgi:hypothetical protein|nr:hypothetical protein [Pseudonocardiaceae bacterium]